MGWHPRPVGLTPGGDRVGRAGGWPLPGGPAPPPGAPRGPAPALHSYGAAEAAAILAAER